MRTEDRLRLRQLEARPVLDRTCIEYLLEIQLRICQRAPEGRAVRYALETGQR